MGGGRGGAVQAVGAEVAQNLLVLAQGGGGTRGPSKGRAAPAPWACRYGIAKRQVLEGAACVGQVTLAARAARAAWAFSYFLHLPPPQATVITPSMCTCRRIAEVVPSGGVIGLCGQYRPVISDGLLKAT